MRIVISVMVAIWALLGPLHAQANADPLRETERLIEAHRYGEARDALASFWSRAGDSVRGDQRARALYLRSVLAESLDDAERDLLRIVIEHPQAADADRALFRLALSRTARGDSEGAGTYLERLVRDYPTSPLRSSARVSLGLGSDESPAPPTPAPAGTAPAGRAAAAGAVPARGATGPAAAATQLTVQVGQFATFAGAETLRDQLRAAGFQPYLARVGQSGMTVVRVGQYPDRAAAEAMARRIGQAGFSTRVTSIYAN
jgi:hypothetical protein